MHAKVLIVEKMSLLNRMPYVPACQRAKSVSASHFYVPTCQCFNLGSQFAKQRANFSAWCANFPNISLTKF